MSANPISPTVGRVVLFRSADRAQMGPTAGEEVPALVTHVWSDTCINVMVMRDGAGSSPICVTSWVYDDDMTHPSGWRWMPYQVSKAAAGG